MNCRDSRHVRLKNGSDVAPWAQLYQSTRRVIYHPPQAVYHPRQSAVYHRGAAVYIIRATLGISSAAGGIYPFKERK